MADGGVSAGCLSTSGVSLATLMTRDITDASHGRGGFIKILLLLTVKTLSFLLFFFFFESTYKDVLCL